MVLEHRRKSPELQTVFSQVLQNVADRVAEAFRNYFESRASFPRKKKPRKYLSLISSQASKSRMEGCIYHMRSQDLHTQAHRRQYSEAHHQSAKQWYAIFTVEREVRKMSADGILDARIKGIDLGQICRPR